MLETSSLFDFVLNCSFVDDKIGFKLKENISRSDASN
jgi:hypothetical protein